MKKFNLKSVFFLLLTIAAMTIFFCTPAMAYSPKVPTGLHQTSEVGNCVYFTWDLDTQAKNYGWQWCSETDYKADRWSDIEWTSNTSDFAHNLQNGTFYYVRLRACYPDGTSSAWCEPVQMTTTPHNIPEGLGVVTRTSNSLTLKWNPSQTANIYYVSCSENGYVVKDTTTKSTTVKFTGLKPDTSYTIKVWAGRRTTSDYWAYAGTNWWNDENFATLPKSVGGIRLYDPWLGGSTYNFEWNSPGNAQSGWQLEYKDLSNGKKRTVTTTSSNCKLSLNLSKTRFYQVRIRSYMTGLQNKRSYSSWSKYTCVNSSNAPKLTRTSSGIKASWSKIYGATSYTVMAKKSGEDTYHKVATTTSRSVNISKIDGVKVGKGTYYVYVIANRKSGSKTYKSSVCSTASIYR